MSKLSLENLVSAAKAVGYKNAEIIKIDEKETLPKEFYQHIINYTDGFYFKNFYIKGTTGEIEIYDTDLILERQAGYEFIGKDKDNKVPEWKSHWLVIGDMASDPFILDLHSGAIMGAQHGIGEWAPIRLCSNFEEFIKILNIWIDVYINEYKGKSHNDDFSINMELLHNLEYQFSAVVSKDFVKNLIKFYDLSEE